MLSHSLVRSATRDSMKIAVPKEIKKQEYRVGLLPSVAYQLTQQGHTVLVAEGDLVVKVKEPLPEEYGLLLPGQVLFTYFHLAADRELTEAVCRSGVTALAYETIEVNGRLPLLEPMSEIAGRMSVLVGGYFLARHYGGAGILLGGVPGVLPGRVMVLGGGVAGVNAARMATGLAADVTILEVDAERMRFLDITLHTANTLYSSEAHILEQLPRVDLLIGAVLVPGAKAPKLISRDMLRRMRPGSVLVDIAIDPGGCRRDVAPDHPSRPGVRRGRRDPLLRGQHAGRLRAHRHPGADQRHPSLRRDARQPWPRRGLRAGPRAGRRHQRAQWPPHLPRRRPSAWPKVARGQAVNQGRFRLAKRGSGWLTLPRCKRTRLRTSSRRSGCSSS